MTVKIERLARGWTFAEIKPSGPAQVTRTAVLAENDVCPDPVLRDRQYKVSRPLYRSDKELMARPSILPLLDWSYSAITKCLILPSETVYHGIRSR